LFKTHDEAVTYAKDNPGSVVTRSENGNGYMVKSKSKVPVIDSELRPLFIDTKAVLNHICSCILQTDKKTTYNLTSKAGDLLASKLAGLGISGGFLGLVSTFGTAGTGTAIGTLSGAAATNATLAWVGGIVGGGMFAGAIITAGLTFASGAYAYKLFKSKPREYDELEPTDRQVVDKCIILIRVIDEAIKGISIPSKEIVKDFGKNDIMELYKLIKDNKSDIKSRLDTKNNIAFTAKSLPSLDKIVIRYSEIKA
jgi:hypothetical protein